MLASFAKHLNFVIKKYNQDVKIKDLWLLQAPNDIGTMM
jgi:hypothetical protein